MEIFNNATCIPPISGKLLYGYRNNLGSLSECENKWKELTDSERSKYVEDSKKIRYSILTNLRPIRRWENDSMKDISPSKLFYYFNYSTQKSIFPHLSETEIFEKCRIRLNKIRNEDTHILSIIGRHIERIREYIENNE